MIGMRNMTRVDRRRLLTAIVTAAAFMTGSVAASAAYRHEETVTKRIETEGAAMILLETMSGDVTVIGDGDREDIEVVIIKRVRAEDEGAAREIADKMGIIVTRPGEGIKVETRFPRSGKVNKSIFSFFLGRDQSMEIELKVSLPEAMGVVLATASGDIEVTGTRGDIEVSSASGDILVRESGGDVKAVTASGDIDLSDTGGDAELTSASGDIAARVVAGYAAVESATGDIDLSSIAGSVSVESYNGDVMVDGAGGVEYEGISGSGRFIDIRGPVEASAASGDLTFRVAPEGPSDFRISTSSGNVSLRFIRTLEDGFVLKASTTTGEIKAELPIKITRVDRNRIAGIVRKGVSKVLLETASGDITIEETGE